MQAAIDIGVMGRQLHARASGGLAIAQLRPTVPEHEVRRHHHADMHLVVLLAGRYVSEAAGMPEVCDEPAVILNPPGTEHRDRFRSRDGLFLTLAMPGDAYARLGDGVAIGGGPVRLPRASLARALQLLPELHDWDGASPLAIESIFGDLLADAAMSKAAHADGAGVARVHQLLDCAEGAPPTIVALAAAAGLHPVYLARAFRKRYGLSPSEFMRRRRLHRALSRIAQGRTLARAAAALGFVDESHLHRCFVREFGITPGAFRRLLLGRREVARIQDRLLPRC